METKRQECELIIARIASETGQEETEIKQEIIDMANGIRFGEWNQTVRDVMDYYRLEKDDAEDILRWGEDN